MKEFIAHAKDTLRVALALYSTILPELFGFIKEEDR